MNNLTRWNPLNEIEDLMNRYNRIFGLTRPGEREGKDLFSRSDWRRPWTSRKPATPS